ncbi:hypothetical protein, partial [Paenibacillus amylolyticus]|uniref:hypothetical protein n=1 Tax=Paenibacillus amylolyticus TaxID=1451 RepID=UPI003396498B
ELVQGMNKEQENIRGQNDVFPVVSEDEEAKILERRMGLSEPFTPVMAREHPVTLNAERHEDRQFEIRRSNKFSNGASGDLFARIFPHLFPF